ncbi:MAG: hypothetical protein LBB11_02155 [Puniceicoccales bacterium]|nr:hypothetical protein [Puniceicoccales bacterium]
MTIRGIIFDFLFIAKLRMLCVQYALPLTIASPLKEITASHHSLRIGTEA